MFGAVIDITVFFCQLIAVSCPGVFKGMTRYTAAAGSLEGCSFMSAGNAGGIMCCKDDSTTPTFPPTSVPTGGACDFEGDMCNWIVNQLTPGKFTRRRGETPSRNTGPRYDNTKQDSTGKLLTHSFIRLVLRGRGKGGYQTERGVEMGVKRALFSIWKYFLLQSHLLSSF